MSNGGVMSLSDYLNRQPIFPVRGGRVSGGAQAGHVALDIRAPAGTTVYASEGGIVTRVQDLARGYGRHIEIRTPSGVEVIYAHLQDFAVRMGQAVTRGQPIGRVGSTGASSGPHLHFEVQRPGAEVFRGGRSAGTAIDPNTYLRGAVSSIDAVRAKSADALKTLAGIPTPIPEVSLTSTPSPVSAPIFTPPIVVPVPMPPPTPTTQVSSQTDEEDVGLDPFGLKGLANKYIRRSAFFFAGMVLIVVGLFMLSSGLREQAGPAAMKAIKVVGGAAVGGPAGAAAGAIT